LSAQQSNIASSKPSGVDEVWLGTLTAGAASLRVQIKVKSDAADPKSCTLDSLDQHAIGLECANVQFAAPNFSFDVPAVKGHWEGKLSEDGKSLNGNWSQGSALVLNFTRQQAAINTPHIAYDPVIAHVSAGEMQGVLDKDLAGALKSGQLAPATGGGVTIGVVQHGIRRVFSYGAVKPHFDLRD
jgi:serine-type D-Ala-D-Ala carboxypeptidase/endopeptidase